ncbi:MAG: baseplate J/gp47 family protein, partial [Vicinamibacterales bacterium]
VTQATRRLAALDPLYARLDDRSVVELLDHAVRVAGLVRFYGPDDRVAGDWVEMLTSEPLVALASMTAVDVARVERRLAALIGRTRTATVPERKHARLAAVWDLALDLPRQVERWHRGLARPQTSDLGLHWSAAIGAAIDQTFAPAVRQLKAWDAGAAAPDALGAALGADYAGFSAKWALDTVTPDPAAFTGGSPAERIDRAIGLVLPVWRPIAQQVTTWAATARPELARALEQRDAVPPHIALLIAFVRLFATAQETLNALPARRTGHYYEQMLGERRRPAVPDAAHVAFHCQPSPAAVAITVPAGTRLSAGKDAARRDIIFVSQHDVTVTPATLARALTLRVESAPIGEGWQRPPVPHRILGRAIDPWSAGDAWAVFGSPDDAPAEVGFAVSAPALRLSGGERSVELRLRTAPQTAETRDAVHAAAAPTGATATAVLAQVLAGAFTLEASTAAGWYAIDSYTVAGLREDADGVLAFTLRFSLSVHAPPVDAPPGTPGATSGPVVRALLRQRPLALNGPRGVTEIYPLAVLHGLRIATATVRVDVTALPGLRVFNGDGEVDATRPFAVFGAAPLTGAALRIRHEELFTKRLDRIALRLRWADLPLNRTGFRGYYRRYVLDADGAVRPCLFDNQSFRVAISVEQPGPWVIPPTTDTEEAFLFRTVGRPDDPPEPERPLLGATTLSVSAAGAGPVPAGYRAADAAITVELRRPAYGFGMTLFAPNMARAMAVAPPAPGADGPCRPAYAPIADARRQLDDLLGTGRFARLAALIDEAPSPSRPRRTTGQIRSAVRNLSGSWRAILRGRPGIEPPSDWLVRNQEAHLDDDEAADPSYRELVQTTVTAIVRGLLEAAGDGLSDAVEEAQDRLDAATWQAWMLRLDQARRGGNPDRLRALHALYTEAADVWGEAAVQTPALERSRAMLLAATMVQDCDAHADHIEAGYRRSVRANIRACVTRLQSLYETSVERCQALGVVPPVPPPPYVPRVDALTLDYTASGTADVSHVLPFGGWSPLPFGTVGAPTLLPQFAHAGYLFLGLSGLTTPQTVRFYASMHPGAGPSAGPEPAWEYLDPRGWVRLDAPHADADTTLGLRQSGTVSLVLPAIDTPASTWLPRECRWVRAVVPDGLDTFPDASTVLLNAVLAVRQTVRDDPDAHQALPAGALKSLVTPIKGIAGVSHPGASFGGRPPEGEDAFRTRMSERLRHKGRAVTAWDYERLVLEQWPDIWSAVVLPAQRRRAGEPAAIGAGHVRVLVVPGPSCPDVRDVTAPVASPDRLASMARTLERLSGRVRVHVENVSYVRVRVAASIEWRDQVDPHASARALDADLRAHLSPWRADVRGANAWSEADLRHFIASRPEVSTIQALHVEFDPPDAAGLDSGAHVVTTATSHAIRSAVRAPQPAADGY